MTNIELFNYSRLNSKNIKELQDNYIKYIQIISGCELEKFIWGEFNFSRVCNYHSCPINGVTNWGNKDKNKPSFYYGWSVYIQGIWNKKPKMCRTKWGEKNEIVEESFASIQIFSSQYGYNHGSFNGGRNFSGELRIFIDDFPIIWKNLIDIVPMSELVDAMKKSEIFIKRELLLRQLL